MPTKTERIISYLPSTFDASRQTSVLYNIVDAFGGELLAAENSLAALMAAHWVDHADRASELIDDLACLARLYGLAPRAARQQTACGPVASEESVEEFREHLKHYVRTFLEGTTTVQGILRIAAEVLHLRIEDDYADLDTWWKRDDDSLVVVAPRNDDAARTLLGKPQLSAAGAPARPARIVGGVDLSGGVSLAGGSRLAIKVDDAEPVLVDLVKGTGKTEAVTLAEVARAVNDALGARVATHDGRRLTIASPTIGPASNLEIRDVEQDAAGLLLGLAPSVYHGAPSVRAQVTGGVDLSGGADLRAERFLRLLLDGRRVAEIDCAGHDPAHTTLEEIVRAINGAFGQNVASVHAAGGRFLRLASPTNGAGGSLAFQPAAAQDARQRLLGDVPLIVSGRNPQPAEAVGRRDLSRNVDLSERARVRVRLDGQPAVIINCVGEEPARTRLDEVVAALATRLGAGIASHDGRFVHLFSPTEGPDGTIAFESLPEDQDATDLIFGFPRRIVRGGAARRAALTGSVDLSGNYNASALDRISIALDGGRAVEVNLLRGVRKPPAVTLEELVAAINGELRVVSPAHEVATHDGRYLTLSSPTLGSASRVAVEPLLETRRSRFVTRASTLDEAAQAAFGLTRANARGTRAVDASVTGAPDLSRGVDLRAASFLRLAVDEHPAIDIDCAGRLPRATTLEEVVAAINRALDQTLHALAPARRLVASATLDGKRLLLTSPTSGAAGRIAFEPPRATDALKLLLGLEPQSVFGSDPTRVRFVGTADLRAGLDLSAARFVKLVIDGNPPVEIDCANSAGPAHTSLNDIVAAINLKLGSIVAIGDGTHVMLVSQTKGAASRIEFKTPDGPDATRAVFGITPPRAYHGEPAAPARLAGRTDLPDTLDLRVRRTLTIAVNGRPPLTIDCAAGATDPAHVTPAVVVAAINSQSGGGVAALEGRRIVLSSPTAGAGARLELLPSEGADARSKLLGDVPEETRGAAETPASIEGKFELLSPLDLSERHVIKVSIDGGRPFDLDIAGAAPGATSPREIVERINAQVPGLASLTAEGRLLLSAPTSGEQSRIELLPVRTLDLIEYPPVVATDPPAGASSPAREVRHGDGWFVHNEGAAAGELEVELFAPHGTAGPELLNRTTGQRVRLSSVVRPGERVRLTAGADGELRASIESAEGELRPVPREQIVAGPAGAQAHVPYQDTRALTDGHDDEQALLQLHDWGAPSLVVLRARQLGEAGNLINVRGTEANLARYEAGAAREFGGVTELVGRVRGADSDFRLTDDKGVTLAQLRAGPLVELAEHDGRVAVVRGVLHQTDGPAPLLVVEHLDHLFDVTLEDARAAVTEPYRGVRIGAGAEDEVGLVWQINRGPHRSRLVRAFEVGKSDVLRLPRGRSRWGYFDCYGARFDRVPLERPRRTDDDPLGTRFAGVRCTDRAVFDFSRFTRRPPTDEAAVFADPADTRDLPVELRLRWQTYQPGAFVLNLPHDLPERFGGRFNFSRFGMPKESEELFAGVYTEPPPPDNPDHLITRINRGPKTVGDGPASSGSVLLIADEEPAARVPLGFELVTIPFRRPRALTGGTATEAARIYLAEQGAPGEARPILCLRARNTGEWGNFISVAARKSGPARFDVTVSYAGARFEQARQVVLGGAELPLSVEEVLRPGPVGILLAKAAGVQAQVKRTRAGDPQSKA